MSGKHKHYVPLLKGKRAEFAALGSLKDRTHITPLLEAVPSAAADAVPQQLEKLEWPSAQPYLVDLLFFDDESLPPGSPPLPQVMACMERAQILGQTAIPVTGTGRSPSYQTGVQQWTQNGVAVRLIPEDFEDEIEDALLSLAELLHVGPKSIDLLIDLGSIADQSSTLVAQIFRTYLSMLPSVNEWRTLTVAAGSFPLGLAPLPRNAWTAIARNDWLAWLTLIGGSRKPVRMPAFGDYAIAHPNLPPEGQATILAQLRYTNPTVFNVWKGRNAVTEGFDQFLSICQDLIGRPEFSGAGFSAGDQEIAEKAANGGSPGNAQTWRKIGTNHHIETVLDQIANLP